MIFGRPKKERKRKKRKRKRKPHTLTQCIQTYIHYTFHTRVRRTNATGPTPSFHPSAESQDCFHRTAFPEARKKTIMARYLSSNSTVQHAAILFVIFYFFIYNTFHTYVCIYHILHTYLHTYIRLPTAIPTGARRPASPREIVRVLPGVDTTLPSCSNSGDPSFPSTVHSHSALLYVFPPPLHTPLSTVRCNPSPTLHSALRNNIHI